MFADMLKLSWTPLKCGVVHQRHRLLSTCKIARRRLGAWVCGLTTYLLVEGEQVEGPGRNPTLAIDEKTEIVARLLSPYAPWNEEQISVAASAIIAHPSGLSCLGRHFNAGAVLRASWFVAGSRPTQPTNLKPNISASCTPSG